MPDRSSALVPLLLLTLIVPACGRYPSAPIVRVPPEVFDAPGEIVVSSTVLRLETYLWRNFQPGPSPDTRLLAQLTIRAASASVVPPGIAVERAWLILSDEAWVSTPRQESPPSSASRLEYMSRGGPQWPVGTRVTAVVQVRDASNNSYLLRAEPQAIGAAH